MNKRMEILVEDYSMEVFLKGLLPRILPEDFELGRNCFIYPHEGKSDLKKAFASARTRVSELS